MSETIEKIAKDIQAQADVLAMCGPQPLNSHKVASNLKCFAARLLENLPPAEVAGKKGSCGGADGEAAQPRRAGDGAGENWRPLEIPECGIDFRRYYSADCEVYICAWRCAKETNSHVYEVRCSRFEGQWRATLSNDGRTVGELLSPGRHTCYMLALGAMRAYLRSGHRKTIKAKKAAAALAGARSDAAEPTND